MHQLLRSDSRSDPRRYPSIQPLSLACMLAMGLAGTTATAQQQQDEGAGAQEVVITTGSRIRNTSGMETPNPVTVVTLEEIDLIAPTTMIEGLAELPQFYGSNTTQNTQGFFTTEGAGSLNLRGLQSKRTLQLLNGRRVVQSTIFGGPDINLFPEKVIRSVETVTGGASAAYGTDAVAGAVNFILDTDFEGFKGSLQSGATSKGHNDHFEISFGAGFSAGERTHILLSAERSKQDPIWNQDILEYDWYTARDLIENPDPNAGESPANPFFIEVHDVRSRNYDINGIFHLPAAAGGNQILDEDGNPSPFVLGSPCNIHGCSTTNGGSGNESGLQTMNITPDSARENLFAYIEHDATDRLKIFGQAIHGEADFTSLNFGGLFPNPPFSFLDRHFTIYDGNPFLPPAIQQAMTDNGLESVPFSRIGAPEDIAHSAATSQITETDSYTVGFDYAVTGDGFFDGWLASGYFQTGQTDVNAIQRGGIRLDRIYLAADVVIDPATNEPACNVTVVSGLYPDCVPLNLFGRGNASPEAVDWVTGFEPGVVINANGFLSATESIPHSYVSTEDKMRVIEIEQDVWEISADGPISDGWGAGPVTMAFGYGEREESFVQVVRTGPGGNINADPTFRPVMANDAALGIRGVPPGNAASGNHVEIQFSNVPHARGSQDVREAFVEFLIPLVSDRPIVQQLNFSVASRWADYSGSGDINSWKGGLDWRVNDILRLRTTVSRDVRAATIGEKFDRTGGIGNVTDWLLDPGGGLSYSITTFSNGTPDILPENATTRTLGAVIQPRGVQGLSFSLDYYEVVVTDNINQSSAGAVTEGCYVDGDQDFCRFITRGGPPSVEDPNINYISLVGVPYFNQNAVEAIGVDFEVLYNRNVNWFGSAGNVNVRMLGSFLNERNNISSDGSITSLAGRNGLPEWTSIISANYSRGPLGLGLTARYTDEMLINPNWNFNGSSTRWDVADNTIDSELIVDARVRYRFDVRDFALSVFATINNLFDEPPTNNIGGPFSSFFSTGTGLGVQGDLRGRRYVVGMTVDF
ncbi:MAG: TonB-dependent receptor [Gammaproteobacteria bacterium]|nr:TonB-dependent receptor [Gammaproteobacteria bacterium]